MTQLVYIMFIVNPLSAKLTRWPNTLKQLVGNLPMNCLSVFGHFVGLALKGLTITIGSVSYQKVSKYYYHDYIIHQITRKEMELVKHQCKQIWAIRKGFGDRDE